MVWNPFLSLMPNFLKRNTGASHLIYKRYIRAIYSRCKYAWLPNGGDCKGALSQRKVHKWQVVLGLKFLGWFLTRHNCLLKLLNFPRLGIFLVIYMYFFVFLCPSNYGTKNPKQNSTVGETTIASFYLCWLIFHFSLFSIMSWFCHNFPFLTYKQFWSKWFYSSYLLHINHWAQQ